MRGLQSLGVRIERESSFIKREAARASHESTTSWAAVPGIQANLTPLLERLLRKAETNRNEIARTDGLAGQAVDGLQLDEAANTWGLHSA